MITRAWQFVKGIFANNGDVQDIPLVQDIANPNRASYADGIPVICSQDKSLGGQPPRRVDFNELFRFITANLLQLQAGMFPTFDTNMITAPQTGYAKGAILYYPAGDNGGGLWLISSKDNNTDNFITTSSFIGTSWIILGSKNFLNTIPSTIDGILYASTEAAALTLSTANPTKLVFYPEN